MLCTAEFYEIMEQFEKVAKKELFLGNQGLKKENKDDWKMRRYYCDGKANEAFKIYLHGVALGKALGKALERE